MGFGAVQTLVGVTKLSELGIDVNKNWLTYLINNLGDPVAAQDGATKAYVDGEVDGEAAARAAADALRLLLTGGTMSGDIAMGDNIVSGLKAPTADGEAARKKYVDDLIAGYSKVVWKDTTEEALFLDNVDEDIGWTTLDLTTLTSVNAKVAIVQLCMSFGSVPSLAACDFYLRKTGTTGPLAAQLAGGYWYGDKAGGLKNSNVLIGLDLSQGVDYKVDIIGNAVVDLWLNIEGYIE